MKALNRVPELLTDFNITAGTDITGFGLAGHLVQMARASKVSLEIDTASLPNLDGALDLLRAEVLNRAHRTNLRYVEKEVDFGSVSQELRWLTLDPQTSGGLLFSVSETNADRALAAVRAKFPHAAVVGRVVKAGEFALRTL